MKKWTQIKGENAWTMFKVIAELVEGFERLNKIGPCVSIFGSARTKPDHPYYQKAVDIARRLTEAGYGVITGGGPGIMEAGNKGASEQGGVSVGINIDLPMEQGHNESQGGRIRRRIATNHRQPNNRIVIGDSKGFEMGPRTENRISDERPEKGRHLRVVHKRIDPEAFLLLV